MKIQSQFLGIAITTVATLGITAPSYALSTLIGNYPPNLPTNPTTGLPQLRTSTISPDGVDPVTGDPNGQKKAVSFTTPASGDLDLVDVNLILTGYDDADDANITIRQGSDILTAPTVATLDTHTPTGIGVLDNFTFTSSTAFTFSPSTTYWLYLDADSAAYNWVSPTAANQVAPSGTATYVGYQFSDDDGTTFSNSGQFNSFLITTDSPTTAVPFDFSATPGLLLVGGLWGANKLRRRGSEAKLIKD
jgi:hypothetical protein